MHIVHIAGALQPEVFDQLDNAAPASQGTALLTASLLLISTAAYLYC